MYYEIVHPAVIEDLHKHGIHRPNMLATKVIPLNYKIYIHAVENHTYEMTYTSADTRNQKYDELKAALRDAEKGVVAYDDGFVRIPMIISVDKS